MNFIQYIKQAWKAGTSGGTPLSPDRLNHIEDGIKANNDMISELNSNMTVNLLNLPLQTTTKNGVTCTNNGDGTYTLNGTASGGDAIFSMRGIKNDVTINRQYKIIGCPAGGRPDNYFLQQNTLNKKGDGEIGTYDYGNGAILTNVNGFRATYITIRQGKTVNNLVFKPMLTTNLSATYDDFVPYTGDTGRLNADVALLKNNVNNRIDNIGKVELNKIYGASSAGTLNIDTIQNYLGYILRCESTYLQGTSPTTVIGENAFLLIGFSDITNQKPRYGVQLAVGFDSNKIAIRNAPYVVNGGSWRAWRAI